MKLKPRPNVLCGCAKIEQLELVQEHSNNEDVFYYQCTVCGRVPPSESSSRKKAIEAWNTRPIEDAFKAHAVEVLADKLHQIGTTNAYLAGTRYMEHDLWELATEETKDKYIKEARALLGWEE